MSHGPGRWQSKILDAARQVQPGEWVFLRDLLPLRYTRSEYSSIMRAAGELQRSGRVVLQVRVKHWGRRFTAVRLAGDDSPIGEKLNA